jgi:hypothetical protein
MAATLIGFTGFALRAEPPELAPLAPQWDALLTLSGGAGFKDNVFLSHVAPKGSAFVSGGAEVMAFRLAPTGPQFNFFGNVDAQRFLARDAQHTEVVAFEQAQLEQEFGERWKGSLALQYLYQDEILDISVSETNREAARVIGHRLTARPGARLNLPHQLWVAVEPGASRQFFQSPLDDYWEVNPTLTLGRNLGRKSEISLGYTPAWLVYDNTPTYTETGAAIPGSQRKRFQQEVRANWRQTWDEPQHWRTTLTLGTKLNEENGGGYFDYTRWLASGRIEYRAEPWRLSATGRLAYYDYANQTVSSTDPSKRRRTEVTFGGQVEWRLCKRLILATGYEYEQVLSDDSLETYTVNTVSGTLRWEF